MASITNVSLKFSKTSSLQRSEHYVILLVGSKAKNQHRISLIVLCYLVKKVCCVYIFCETEFLINTILQRIENAVELNISSQMELECHLLID
jgi:hypothetical protein